MATPLVGLIMGSRSDWETMRHAAETLDELGVPFEQRVVSAHRTPDLLFEYAEHGGGARPPGASSPAPAARPTFPAWPPRRRRSRSSACRSSRRRCQGIDSLLSIVQMPAGVPVATFAIGRAGAVNAALLAAAHPAAGSDGALARAPPAVPRPRRRRRCSTAQIRRRDDASSRASAAVSSGACSGSQGCRSASRSDSSTPSPDACAREVGELVVGEYGDPRRSTGSSTAPTSSPTSSRTSPWTPRAGSCRFPEPRRSRRRRTASARRSCFVRSASTRRASARSRRRGCLALVEDAAARLRRQGAAAGRCRGAGRRRRAGRGAGPVRPRALDRRRPRPGRGDALLARRRERPPRRDPAGDARAGRERAAGRGRGDRRGAHRRARLRRRLAVELFEVAASCWRTSSRRASTTPRTGPSRARRQPVREPPTSDPGLRSAPPKRGRRRMVNLIGSAPPAEALLALPGAHLHLYGKAPRGAARSGTSRSSRRTRTSCARLVALADEASSG